MKGSTSAASAWLQVSPAPTGSSKQTRYSVGSSQGTHLRSWLLLAQAPKLQLLHAPKTREDFWQTKFNQIVKGDVRNRDELLKQGRRVDELWEFGIRRPEVEKNWLLETILECNQKYVSWPDFSDRLALATSSR